ncbi:MAG: helix-turn-helix domain-containing protein [Thermomicrobiales bacterium]
MESFGERLKRLRSRKVWTQVELAEKSRLPVITISRLENGYNNGSPRQSTVERLSSALGVSRTYLLFGEDEESRHPDESE